MNDKEHKRAMDEERENHRNKIREARRKKIENFHPYRKLYILQQDGTKKVVFVREDVPNGHSRRRPKKKKSIGESEYEQE